MMKIELKPMPQPDEKGVICVGTMNGKPFYYNGRIPVSEGHDYEQIEVSDALLEAIERAATEVLGGEWSKPLALVTGLNQRTCNRDRIRQWGLPPWVLLFLARAAHDDDARALGAMAQALARVYDARLAERSERERTQVEVLPKGEMLKGAVPLLERAAKLVEWGREEREKAKAKRARNPFGNSQDP